MTATVDRLEGDYAVLELEGGGMAEVPRAELPAGVRERDKLIRRDGCWASDPTGREAVLDANRARLEALRRKKRPE